MSSRSLFIYGAGGLGSEVAAICESGCHSGRAVDTPQWHVEGFIDDTPGRRGTDIHGIKVLGSFEEIRAQREGTETWCHIAIGDNKKRRDAARRVTEAGWRPATVAHRTAGIAWGIGLGEGTFIGMYATVSPSVRVGRYVIINTRGSIGHHSQLGDFSQLSLNASALGYSKIDEGALIGAHAVVSSGVSVGAWATVAIGTPVLKRVEAGHTICLPFAQTIFKREMPEA